MFTFDFHDNLDADSYLNDFKVFRDRKNADELYSEIIEKLLENFVHHRDHVQSVTPGLEVRFKDRDSKGCRTRNVEDDFSVFVDPVARNQFTDSIWMKISLTYQFWAIFLT